MLLSRLVQTNFVFWDTFGQVKYLILLTNSIYCPNVPLSQPFKNFRNMKVYILYFRFIYIILSLNWATLAGGRAPVTFLLRGGLLANAKGVLRVFRSVEVTIYPRISHRAARGLKNDILPGDSFWSIWAVEDASW